MRTVDRAGVTAPTSIDVAGSAGVLELAAARAHVAAGSSKAFKFAAYKKKDVAAALEELFLGKCAYCESTSAAEQIVRRDFAEGALVDEIAASD